MLRDKDSNFRVKKLFYLVVNLITWMTIGKIIEIIIFFPTNFTIMNQKLIISLNFFSIIFLLSVLQRSYTIDVVSFLLITLINWINDSRVKILLTLLMGKSTRKSTQWTVFPRKKNYTRKCFKTMEFHEI